MSLIVLLLVPLGLAAALWYHRRRLDTLRQWAAGVGWTYVGTDRSLVTRWRGQPFRAGRSKRVSELVTGRFQGYRAMSFCYRYTSGTAENQSTTRYHVIALELPAYLPILELTPDGLGAKLAKTFGGRDLQFESEAFNDAWRVEAHDPKFAHDVLHPRLMERLLRPDATGLSLRIEGTDLLCWTLGGQRLDLVAERLAVMCAIADAVTRFVWLDHGYDPAST
jgi:hypothetical protein